MRRAVAVALPVVVALILALVVVDRSRDDWQRDREACREANARTDVARESRRVQRAFLYTAATARMAAYRRDGHAADLTAAREYLALIRRVGETRRRDCIAALPPPLFVSESDDPGRDSPLSRPRR